MLVWTFQEDEGHSGEPFREYLGENNLHANCFQYSTYSKNYVLVLSLSASLILK